MRFHTRIVRRDQPDNGVWQRGPDIQADDLWDAVKICAHQLQIVPEKPPGYPDPPKPWWKRLFS